MSHGTNDFDFDDFSLDDSNDSDIDFGNNFNSDDSFGESSDESDDFDGLSNTELADKKETRKVSFIAIICGIVLIAVAFLLVGFITKLSNKPKENLNDTNNNVNEHISQSNDNTQSQSGQSEQNNNQINYQNTQNQNQSNNQDWISFSSADGVTFSEDYVDSTFSVTSIKHYVKVVDSDNLMVKTVLTGALSGFTGTYEIEVPFSKGSLLSVGKSFNVSVQVGTNSSGKTIVGEIKV